MKSISNFINEKLIINKDTKPKKLDYFLPEDIDDYVEVVNNAVSRYGYMAVNKVNRAIWIFKRGMPERRQTLKNLVCAINSKTFIEWGPNEYLKDRLENVILDAIKEVDK